MSGRVPEFAEWLARSDEELGTFLREDVSGMPEDPYSEAGLRRAEELALKYFMDMEDLSWEDRRDRFYRFVGEVFVRCFEGRWDWQEVTEWGESRMRPVVELDFTIPHDPEALITRALTKRTGDLIPKLYRFDTVWYEYWVQAGRLTGKAWERESVKAHSKVFDTFAAREAK